MRDRDIPLPVRTPETAEYWDAASRGVLLVRGCRACRKAHHYPRTMCPFCHSDQTEWWTSAGKGVIYSFSIMRRASSPYVIAYVTLDEGPTMLTNIVGCKFDEIGIGRRVSMAPNPRDGSPPIPMFRLDHES